MKCCGSQTISTVPDAERPSVSRAREAASEFDALLVAAAFKPLASALGFYGDLVVGVAAQAMTRAERGGLTDRLERMIATAGASDRRTQTRSAP